MIITTLSVQASEAAALWWELEDLKQAIDPLAIYGAPTLNESLLDTTTIEAFQRLAEADYEQAMRA